MSNWSVYMVKCADGSLYTGISNDVPKRVSTHNAGKGAKYTRVRLPVQLVYDEPSTDRSAASKREAALKKLSRAKKLSLIKLCRHTE
ncbi:MAG: GIY-YIG nuclease family protein [Rhizobiales bacterium]|nr:GIY-YIG nuclease family protein [Hyphomicrobiales bacterium]NRB14563.1 GIY-YIG nuclease family protein [Hyphomicrobiales bacterium]